MKTGFLNKNTQFISFFIIIVFLLSSFKSDKNGNVVIDIDKNIYKTVIIGDQEWMAENLKVSRFRNGDIIQRIDDKEEWVKAGNEGKPAWCYYNNKDENNLKYGKLYNWHAVNDPRGLAPKGFYIASDYDFSILTEYLESKGYINKVGVVLKAINGWTNGTGSDKFGWNGLPGGCRNAYGDFYNISTFAGWWTFSEYSEIYAWSWRLNSTGIYFERSYGDKLGGFYVRCIKN
jgi:uncharacterized protein (TIGR02145 family)